eukprot:CAMPEP_0182866120 /NCGR_PEP_ID=MMETSP0034_2-20130328/8044_1 /TAXON_ID=156128 /ORGANISM="Nephroselmis pyriformis, Strain CCMP717" /LENGTH=71 /DNA_ID=CAMNT_0024998445 /DNA_START=46 /DNA_END=261 /DNA_ORIENTATION=+
MGGAKKKAAPVASAAEKLAKSQKDAQAHICSNCRQTFAGTAKRSVLQTHVDSKHPKAKAEDLFANWANVPP